MSAGPGLDALSAPSDQLRWFAQRFEQFALNVEQVVTGKSEVITLALTALFAEGHVLVEDVPGVGKTSLAKAVARSIDATWHRVQFTPDLLPSDITGVQVFNQRAQEFEFRPGPVFANVVLADEINRASPKTQAALLEVMEENQVTVDSATHLVPRPFIVIATQNPIDLDGTYRLPEAQLDRFLVRTRIGYPSPDAEVEILASRANSGSQALVSPVMTPNEVRSLVAVTREVHVARPVQEYVVRLATATRESPDLRLGASPRACLGLMRAAQARAASQGRAFVTPADVKALAEPVLAHRLVLTPQAEIAGRTGDDVIAAALDGVPVPQALPAGV